MTLQRSSLTYGKQLEIVTEFQKGKLLGELTSTFSEIRSVIQSVLDRQPRFEKCKLRSISALDYR